MTTKKGLLFIFLLLAGTIFGQTVKISISTDIQTRDGKKYYVHTVQKGQTLYSIAQAYHVGIEEIYYANPEAKQGIRVGQKLWIPTINKETEISRQVKTSKFDFFYHVAARGETLEHIASIYMIPKRYILLANPGIKSPLKEGEYVKIPVESAFPILDGKSGKKAFSSNSTSSPRTVVPPSSGTNNQPAGAKTVSVKNTPSANGSKNFNQQPPARQTPHKTSAGEQKTSTPQGYLTHIVKKKETLYSISRLYGIKLKDLYQANPGLTTNILPGQVIRIPKKKINTDFVYYQAQQKIALKKVARLYGVETSVLFSNNPSVGKKIKPGQSVRIPVGEKAIQLAKETQKEQEKPEQPTLPEENSDMASAYGRCQPRPHNRTFKVALMVPLYLEETDSINLTDFMIREQKNFAPFRFVEFLEGGLIASDSLKAQGMHLELYVYDVDQTLTKTSKVLTQPELRDMNLIIGPFYSRSFKQVALFANHFNIPIVNPMTFRTEIFHQHNNMIKVTPDEHRQLPQLAQLIRNEYKNDKVFVISQTPYTDAQTVHALRDSIKSLLPDSVYFSNKEIVDLGIAVTQRNKDKVREALLKTHPESTNVPPKTTVTVNDTLDNFSLEGQKVYPDTLKANPYDTTALSNSMVYINYSRDSLHPFENNASVLRHNLVILYGNKKSFIMDAMNRLNVICDTFPIQMVGLPHWENFQGLNLYQENNMEVIFPRSYFINYDSTAYRQLNSTFYKRFATAPGKYGVFGFDITYYFLRSLFLYGNKFLNCLPKNQAQAISTKYHFEPVNTGNNNYENTYWNWLRIKEFKLIKLPDSLVQPVPYQEK